MPTMSTDEELRTHRELIGKVISLELTTTIDPDGKHPREDKTYVSGTLIGIGWKTRGPWITADLYHFAHGTVTANRGETKVEVYS